MYQWWPYPCAQHQVLCHAYVLLLIDRLHAVRVLCAESQAGETLDPCCCVVQPQQQHVCCCGMHGCAMLVADVGRLHWVVRRTYWPCCVAPPSCDLRRPQPQQRGVPCWVLLGCARTGLRKRQQDGLSKQLHQSAGEWQQVVPQQLEQMQQCHCIRSCVGVCGCTTSRRPYQVESRCDCQAGWLTACFSSCCTVGTRGRVLRPQGSQTAAKCAPQHW